MPRCTRYNLLHDDEGDGDGEYNGTITTMATTVRTTTATVTTTMSIASTMPMATFATATHAQTCSCVSAC